MKIVHHLIVYILTCALLSSCQDKSSRTPAGENSIYYWRTTFSLSDDERAFLQKHEIKKMYVRFFDVTYSYKEVNGENIIPEATIRFIDSIPDNIEIVPTIYITTLAVMNMGSEADEYAQRILKRVSAICKHNKITFNEIQLDCDWTKSSRDNFFSLCEAIKSRMDSTEILSSTIRLHQLTQNHPPVDKGVLMVYNTGNLMERTTDNSIFSQKDIKPYLRDNRLASYPLSLDIAYPTYGWSVVFHPGQDRYYFNRLMRRTDFSSYPALKEIDNNLYEATATINFSGEDNYRDCVFSGYRVKVERPSIDEILSIKNLIDLQLNGKKHNNIIYHLDETQLKYYHDNEISKIYSGN